MHLDDQITLNGYNWIQSVRFGLDNVNRLLNENRRKNFKVKKVPRFLLCMYVCVSMCLFVGGRSTDFII